MQVHKMRAKVRVSNIVKHGDNCEHISFSGVSKDGGYQPDGSDENNTFAMWTPTLDFGMSITNPRLVGTFAIGDTFYCDFISAPK